MLIRRQYSINFKLLIFLFRLLLKFSAPNLLSLHPPLTRGGDETCATCYEEHPISVSSVSGVDFKATVGRGMVTQDDFKVGYFVILSFCYLVVLFCFVLVCVVFFGLVWFGLVWFGLVCYFAVFFNIFSLPSMSFCFDLLFCFDLCCVVLCCVVMC